MPQARAPAVTGSLRVSAANPLRELLDTFLFRGFDLEHGTVDLSRHSVAHGVAAADQYTRIRALQVILSLDQMHHYIMNRST